MKLTLPHSQSSPPTLSKFPRDDFVAGHVAVELTLPEFESAFRGVRKLPSGMSMPEPAIDK